ncbi:hypothetical protein GCM10020370_40750 [Paenibacillus hodogayensis]
MKKRLTVSVLATLLLASVGTILYSIEDNKISIKEVHASAWVIPYNSLQELEKDPKVNVIVEGTVTENTSPRKITGNQSPVNYNAMLTEIKIDKIIKSDGKIDNNKTVFILEPTFLEDNGILPGKTEYPMFDYLKATPGRKYIFYLAWNDSQQAYWVHGANQGKYNIDGKDQRELITESNIENYHNLKKSVLEKYGPDNGK